MMYVTRSENGKIVAVYNIPQSNGQEFVPNATIERTDLQMYAQLREGVISAVDKRAINLGFQSAADAATYVGEPTYPKAQSLAVNIRKWRSECLVFLKNQFDATPEGQPYPTLEYIIDNMPNFSIPGQPGQLSSGDYFGI